MTGAARTGSHSAQAQAQAQALADLRSGRAATAERRLRALTADAAADASGLHLLGAALLYQDKVQEALAVLERAVAADPQCWAARADRARAYRAAGRLEAAQGELQQVVAAAPALEAAWLAYGDLLVDLRRYPEARAAYERARRSAAHAARIEAATAALVGGDRKTAELIFRDILQGDASHVAAVCGLAAVSLAAGRPADALRLLRHALRQSAHLPLIWRGLGQTYGDLGLLAEAEAAARRLLDIEPKNPMNWVLLGNVCTRCMRQPEALLAFERAAQLNPREVRLRLSIGHLHKTLGNRQECEAAYHACLQVDPSLAEAYWSLADLKNYVFSDREVAAMRSLLQAGTDDAGQTYLHFALGRALEQRQDYDAAFAHYASGNARRRAQLGFDIAFFEAKTRRVCETFDASFFASRAGAGCSDRAPLFVVGLPRSGSTLVEQILASHPDVEGTFELPNVLRIVREFDHADAQHDAYPENVAALPAARFDELGRRYLRETAALRGDRPRFIDKMPNNFSHVGLIHAMLPHATIIDVRRHPLDACFSTFKQLFAEGQSFGYDLEDLGRYYRCYLRLMDHWHAVLPGRVMTLHYEALVREPEPQIRRLLAHCRLKFAPACLAFHETRRPVRTASAEQVRQPLYATGVGYWKHFAAHLEPLRRALGDTLARFTAD